MYLGLPLLGLTVLQVLVLHRLGLDWATAANDSLVSNLFLALMGLEVNVIYHYYQPGKENRFHRIVFGLILAFLYCLVLDYLPGIILPETKEYRTFLDASMPVRFVFALLVVFFFTLIHWIQGQLTEKKEMEKRKAESEQLMKEAELARLREQLHPHFLFNSLNSINALIGRQPEAARKMIQNLSDFLRGTLKKEDKSVSLKEELDHLKLYLEIEKVRFGSRLEIEFVTNESCLDQTIPSLLLQPIIENAIKFGLYDVTEHVLIRISCFMEEHHLCIEVSNPFDAASKSEKRGTGFGLASVARRLQLLYARNDLLTTFQQDQIFTTRLRIPEKK